ncbi:hypothetical protein MW722_001458 [Acinetobacter baumannii]|uniref:Uncharacterized protein n=3 Tax=Acinetobacter baumannii TaxID=470 RepID=A0AAN6AJ29_ACIBA|nr:hypothetical protein [Acinetobacter baumannii]EMT94548.1 hypothetical protein ABNIH5_00035 [Acinetobacter baumannii ABNIH5]ETY66866.1 hypothetical protein X964_18135 [Acinetobacter baumannii MDR_MMC4]EXB15614.1 hypothetical protein J513_0344 [Acinetobacter baumannii 1397084]EXD24051.1 hypothetical protein J480_2021 [Acinetobacter baumannii 34654]EYD07377.1 hypothetical protein J935_2895 [Acinetobacter baumannii 44362_2]EYU47087.1 hypothetical protein J616_03994 [Acinetobacter baumannii 145
MPSFDSKKFYDEKGLVRKPFTVTQEASEIIARFAEKYPTLTQGDIVSVLAGFLEDDRMSYVVEEACAKFAEAKPPKIHARAGGRPKKKTEDS